MACSSCGCSSSDGHDKKKADIVDTAVSAGKFKTLVAAVTTAELVSVLKSDGPFTVLAPTDAAFDKLPHGTVDSLLKPENREQLVSILTYHVIAGEIEASAAIKAGEATTLQGGELEFSVESADGKLMAMVNDINIVYTDIETSNGIIHVIDEVLIPEAE
ncbi:fasciclin domain-containing protein [Mucisphaera calidilacus]|nr:fasciclin domain-containing protein [Mucisphaera calidilacus]